MQGPIKSPKIAIQNIVVSADLHATIDLYALSKEVKAVDYEPEQFPGAIFRIAEPKAVKFMISPVRNILIMSYPGGR